MKKRSLLKMKSIQILGRKYRIKIVKPLIDEGEHVDGYLDDIKDIIFLDEKDDKQCMERVLLHEITHAIFREGALNETSISNDLEEIIVEQIAKVMITNFTIQSKGD